MVIIFLLLRVSNHSDNITMHEITRFCCWYCWNYKDVTPVKVFLYDYYYYLKSQYYYDVMYKMKHKIKRQFPA